MTELSIRAYARHRGVSHTAVSKAIKSGRITTNANGKINPETADKQWDANTNHPAKPRKNADNLKAVPHSVVDSVNDTLKSNGTESSGSGAGSSYMQAKTANEVLKAQTNRLKLQQFKGYLELKRKKLHQTNRLKLQQFKGELINRNEAISHVFRMARDERDAWLNWPIRVSAIMAAELAVDPHTMHQTLEKYVREHLEELSKINPKL